MLPDNYPLQSLTATPLHAWQCAPKYEDDDEIREWACQTSERELEDVQFDWRCPACVDWAIGYLDVHPDVEQEWYWRPDEPVRYVMFSWLVERAVFFRRT